MTLFIPEKGRQKPKGVKLADTNATTIISGPASGVLTLDSLSYSCGGTTSTLSVWITDGTTSWYLMNGKSIAINTYDIIKDHHLQIPTGWSLKAQASAANQIDLIAVVSYSAQVETQK